MVTIYKDIKHLSPDRGMVIYDVRCKSTDTKPTEGVPNGSQLIEIDSGKVYLFDADTGSWNEI